MFRSFTPGQRQVGVGIGNLCRTVDVSLCGNDGSPLAVSALDTLWTRDAACSSENMRRRGLGRKKVSYVSSTWAATHRQFASSLHISGRLWIPRNQWHGCSTYALPHQNLPLPVPPSASFPCFPECCRQVSSVPMKPGQTIEQALYWATQGRGW
jgi:hypothetical protein